MRKGDRMDKLLKLAQEMGLDWVVFNEHNLGRDGRWKLVIAPFEDGSVPREDLLKREIPLEFLAAAKKLFPHCKVVVRGLITQREKDLQLAYFAEANALCG